jgi:hypothetical protein
MRLDPRFMETVLVLFVASLLVIQILKLWR